MCINFFMNNCSKKIIMNNIDILLKFNNKFSLTDWLMDWLLLLLFWKRNSYWFDSTQKVFILKPTEEINRTFLRKSNKIHNTWRNLTISGNRLRFLELKLFALTLHLHNKSHISDSVQEYKLHTTSCHYAPFEVMKTVQNLKF